MPKPPTNIVLVGVGGQGILLASEILAQVAFHEGYDVKMPKIDGLQFMLLADDLTTLFQTNADTTPVTASGQTVGRWRSTSHGANAMNFDEATNKPISEDQRYVSRAPRAPLPAT